MLPDIEQGDVQFELINVQGWEEFRYNFKPEYCGNFGQKSWQIIQIIKKLCFSFLRFSISLMIGSQFFLILKILRVVAKTNPGLNKISSKLYS